MDVDGIESPFFMDSVALPSGLNDTACNNGRRETPPARLLQKAASGRLI
jgi:hypothetical protein